jgi:hypothetical protein
MPDAASFRRCEKGTAVDHRPSWSSKKTSSVGVRMLKPRNRETELMSLIGILI